MTRKKQIRNRRTCYKCKVEFQQTNMRRIQHWPETWICLACATQAARKQLKAEKAETERAEYQRQKAEAGID